MSPTEHALAIVRAGLHAERVWLGETTDAAEQYVPRHAKETRR